MRSVNTNCVTDLAKYGPIFLFPFQALKTVFFKLDNRYPSHTSFNSSRMAPSTSNVKNSGAVHLSCIAVLSNPRRCGTGSNSLALDLHLLLESSGSPVERTILARYFNMNGLSFDKPRVCSVNISVCLSPTQSFFNLSNRCCH